MSCLLLQENYDKERLKKEVDKLRDLYVQKRYVPGKSSKKLYDNTVGWKGIPLRNSTGDITPKGLRFGGSENISFKCHVDTIYLKKSAYIQKILNDIRKIFKTEIGLVRILKLDKHGKIAPHRDGNRDGKIDSNTGFGKTVYRLHIPIITDNKVIFTIDNIDYNLKEGNLYYTDVSKVHSVVNGSSKDRIHIVIDVKVTDEIKSII
jgi:hypothetical protein